MQRIAVARALIPKPKLIVADEPVSMVDASLRMSIVNLFRALRDELKVSIIYITHDLATAYYISDRVIIMRKGVVVESGDARTVLDNPHAPLFDRAEERRAAARPDPSRGHHPGPGHEGKRELLTATVLKAKRRQPPAWLPTAALTKGKCFVLTSGI